MSYENDLAVSKENAIEIRNIRNDYFEDLSFECKKGEILGVYDLQNKFSRELKRVLLGKKRVRLAGLRRLVTRR